MSTERTARSIRRLLALRWGRSRLLVPKLLDGELPLRSELLSAGQMDEYARTLAESHGITNSRSHGDKLLSRLVENESILNEVRNLLTEVSSANGRIGPAGEWLLDNFYLIEEHIRTSKRDLPVGYSRELSGLASGDSAGLPRVYDIALERISHGDGLVDPETLPEFFRAYQSVSVLTLGELWAVPIMLRLAVIENLRRVSVRISTEMQAQREADSWADQMTETAESDPKSLILLIADMARSDPPMNSSFVAELSRKLQGRGASLALPLTWIEQRLSETGLTIDRLVQSAMQQQAADQVSISNSIRSLRSLGATDWKTFVESTSAVEKVLSEDPTGSYGKMDFTTRDQYRHVVEAIARKYRITETEVASAAVALAGAGFHESDADNRAVHVGYYLVDQGQRRLRRSVSNRKDYPPVLPSESPASATNWVSQLFYFGSILLLSVATAIGFTFEAHSAGLQIGVLWIVGPLAFLCAVGMAVSLINWLVTLIILPRRLPRMDFSNGIPPGSRTLVVVPAMLPGADHIDRLVEALEVRFLANRDENLFFGLLTDLPDADVEVLPGDAELIDRVRQKIEGLNNLYRDSAGDPFFLFHRARKWNESERLWMGHERKRGKLTDLNALLRGGETERFAVIEGTLPQLAAVKYVITLDSDTQLPRDSARVLAGTMAHPLNRPCHDERTGRVVAGYGILQPRVATMLPDSNRSPYAILSGSEPGIDPYTRAVSDVYQDLFGEGSFIGKGIYDVDAFERSLKGRFPENRILSHDLLEGCYARSGLVSDVLLFEGSPSTFRGDVDRRRRWIRGDWQLAQWLLPFIHASEGGTRRNALSMLSRWKIFDNLRRSVAPAALTLLLIIGWFVFSNPLFWTLSVIGIVLVPPLLVSLLGFFRKSRGSRLGKHIGDAIKASLQRVTQGVLTLLTLPYEAYYSFLAIVRTVWRVLFTRRRLLEWRPSDQHDRNARTSFAASLQTMSIGPVLGASIFALLLVVAPDSRLAALPMLLLWFVSPFIMWWVSRPFARRSPQLSEEQDNFLRRLSRKTWSFFETFVTEEDHWLPPDNYQEFPVAKIAHRTSPTNMGLALLADLAAYDFGYLSAGTSLERISRTLHTMEELERHRNHFYNWYDTQTLEPLLPRYVSTVDSGNLAAHLLTLRAGLIAMSDELIPAGRLWGGIADTALVLDAIPSLAARPQFSRFQKVLEKVTSPGVTMSPSGSRAKLAELLGSAGELAEVAGGVDDDQTTWWVNALARQCREAIAELDYLMPWLSHVAMFESYPDLPMISDALSLRELFSAEHEALRAIEHRRQDMPDAGSDERLDSLYQFLSEGLSHAEERIALIGSLSGRIEELASMDFEFLYDNRLHLFAIGYEVDGRRRDIGYYDLLASEARLASFVAIAQGQVPQEHWFALGRLLANAGGKAILFAWSGSMFEYLMPLLVMPSYENTLIDQTCKGAVSRQIDYGRHRSVPWGVSESGYNSFDVGLNYQYRAFGVPGLGFKRGLVDDLVVAPYASALALLVSPERACLNLQRLSRDGFEGAFGLYEAIDYTASRVPTGETSAVVRSFMAHHQGMSFLSFASRILNQKMQNRFESIPMIRATVLLLEEKIPRVSTFHSQAAEMPEFRVVTESMRATTARIFTTADTPVPEVHLLSNGRYNVMVTNAGGGYSRWKGLAVTRWREDVARDNWGMFLYIRDAPSGALWSNTFQPTLKRPDSYEAIFSEGRAEFRRHDHEIDTYTEIAVSPEDDIELRRIRISNRSRVTHTIDVTSYSEIVLASAASDDTHAAFSNLFVQTEIIRDKHAIVCTRRPRSEEEKVPWMVHLMTLRGVEDNVVSYETDRMRFIGRRNSTAAPAGATGPSPLSGSEGSVLDPIASIRYRIVLEPDARATIDMVTGVGETRESVLQLAEKYQSKQFANRAFELAGTHSKVVLQQINGNEEDAQLYGHLAGSILYAHAGLRGEANTLLANRRGQSEMWGYSISGDLPIVLLKIGDPANVDLVRQLVQAHAYWRQKGLAVDLVIWNEEHGGYRQQLQEQIVGLVAAGVGAYVVDRPGGIFVRSADQISNEDRNLFQAAARTVISDQYGTLEEQIDGRSIPRKFVPLLSPGRTAKNNQSATAVPRRDLLFFNGIGGFSPDGREYVIATARGQATPMPWVNVIANPNFGTVVSESGAAYTWSENAHEFRLSPWYNDPVSDSSGEATYIRDEESGQFWSPAGLPCRGETPYVTRHGFGYSVFEHSEQGVSSELWVFVAPDAAVKFTVLKVRNESGRTRRLSATSYAELVLGELRSKSAMHIVSEIDAATGAIFFQNWYSAEFAGRTVFFDTGGVTRTLTCDRLDFLGRNRTLRNPDAMSRTSLSGRVGAGLDPCAAIQVPFELASGEECEIVFRLGAGRDARDARELARRFQKTGSATAALDAIRQQWFQKLTTVQIETPDPAINVLANGWLLYQVISARLWGRSGYYQSGGAFGFRDQLQDSMALIHAEPGLLRAQILLCAAHQFPTGDVQHWWHPPAGRGSRTRCSDDYLWLPLATIRYVQSTADSGVLDEIVHFVDGRELNPDEESYYDLPVRSEQTGSLYDHCVRAIIRGLTHGEHGLPLIGSGDWNDGMNLVGRDGRGESVWLGFFLYNVLVRFSPIAAMHGDQPFADRCTAEAANLRDKLEENGWDGAWYRRAYFDNGTPLGSAGNAECQIDSIAQSWSVLSGAGSSERSHTAMDSLDARLVRRDRALIQLLAPPFDTDGMNPGYIKGYAPGVRENGGQYTHAAVWAAMAFARMGDNQRAWDLTRIINPVNHGSSAEAIGIYKVEPYVIAADVYSVPPHTGRGGWTWYTGSAAWMYRLVVESLMGISLEGNRLRVAPCLPAEWEGVRIAYRYRETMYHIAIEQSAPGTRGMRMSVDGVEQQESVILLSNDQKDHSVIVNGVTEYEGI